MKITYKQINIYTIDKDIFAENARDLVKSIISNAKVINVLNTDRDKYFRILADVEYDDQDLGTFLLNSGYALPYDGGTKPNWCDILTQ